MENKGCLPGGKEARGEADHKLPNISEVKKKQICISTPKCAFMK
jgi:hypothetical protein